MLSEEPGKNDNNHLRSFYFSQDQTSPHRSVIFNLDLLPYTYNSVFFDFSAILRYTV